MEELSFGTCVKKTWISTAQAIMRMPGLIIGTCAVFTCVILLLGSFQQTALEAAEATPSTVLGHAFIRLALMFLQFFAYSSLIIKVSRFVLLGEGTQPLVPLNGRPLVRSLFWLGLAMAIGILALAFVMLSRLVPKMTAAVAILVCGLYLFSVVRLSLLYPAIALGSSLKLRAAWNDTRGHFWSIMGVGVVVYLPLLVIELVVWLVIARLPLANPQESVPLALVQALFQAVIAVLSAATLAWMFRRYANELLRHTAEPMPGSASPSAQ